ncbi:hypothetical protein B0H19DRAFT_1078923 [Mycena capillaripes]|nr:hypothetical protein B0H19DRAFT_1078923 [Mycena capillaripes]
MPLHAARKPAGTELKPHSHGTLRHNFNRNSRKADPKPYVGFGDEWSQSTKLDGNCLFYSGPIHRKGPFNQAAGHSAVRNSQSKLDAVSASAVAASWKVRDNEKVPCQPKDAAIRCTAGLHLKYDVIVGFFPNRDWGFILPKYRFAQPNRGSQS